MRIPAMALTILLPVFFAGTSSQATASDSPSNLGEQTLWDGPSPSFCVSLSGGGIRSGAVSLGVLQALHERGLLTEADLITTVSGGGYPVYGLVAAKVRDPTQTLDSLLDPYGKHVTSAEQTQFISNFDGFFNGVLAALRIFMNGGGLFNEINGVRSSAVAFPYAIDIHDTFVGSPAPNDRGITLQESSTILDALDMPYWILQTSANPGPRPPSDDYVYQGFADVFELSPHWIGSDRTGYTRSFLPKLTLMDSMVASAAAIDTPRVDTNDFVIPNWAKKVGFGLGAAIRLSDNSQVFLTDGGFIENQAVVPALRRRCKLILALDAAHDNDAKMAGWYRVSQFLQHNGWAVNVPYFLSHDGAPATKPSDAWHLPSHLFVLGGSRGTDTTTIAVMKLGIVPSAEALYPAAVRDFWTAQKGVWQSTTGCTGNRLKKRCTFPQQATVTQNFGRNEFRAYRCLGYQMTRDFLSSSLAQDLTQSATTKWSDSNCESSIPEVRTSWKET